MNTRKYNFLFLLLLTLLSCKDVEKERITHLVEKWSGKEIAFPEHAVFTVLGKDTVDFRISDFQYKILTYVDTIGCSSCKLKLLSWKSFIKELDAVANVQFLFYFHPKSTQELLYTIRSNNFTYPVCFDEQDEFNRLNQLSSEMTFQTFLLDENNKVVAIGNPIHNAKIKELYMNIILRDKAPQTYTTTENQTHIKISSAEMNLGKIDWSKEYTVSFTLNNIGDNPLVIADANSSCGCTIVDYCKEPTRPGDSLILYVKYKADAPGYFNKAISVICNTKNSPLTFRVTGEAE